MYGGRARIGVTAFAALALVTCQAEREDRVAPARARIAALRHAGDFAGALQVADSVRAGLERDRHARGFERMEARWRVATMRVLAGLDPSRRALAIEADRLTARIDSLGRAGSFAAYGDALRQVEIRTGLLGARHPEVGEALDRAAAAAENQSQYLAELEHAGHALETLRVTLGDDHPATIRAMVQRALGLRRMTRRVEAESLLWVALRMARQSLGADSPEEAMALMNLGNLRRVAKRFDEAEAFMLRARRILVARLGTEALETAESYEALGLVRLHRDRWALAERELSHALGVKNRLLGPENWSLVPTLSFLGQSLRGLGRYEEAAAMHRRAAGIAEICRGRAPFDDSRAALRLTQYDDLAADLILLGRGDEAWEALDRSRGRMVVERAPAGVFRAAPGTPGDLLARVQRALPERAALVGWLDASPGDRERHTCWGYVVRRSGPVRWVRLPGVRENLASSYVQGITFSELTWRLQYTASWPFRSTTMDSETERARAEASGRFAPLVPHLEGVNELVVVPAAFGCPVEVLAHPNGGFVIDRYGVSYANSAALYADLRERAAGRALRPARALLIGDPPHSQAQLADMAGERALNAGDEPSLPLPSARPADLQVLRDDGSGDPVALARLPRLKSSRWEIRRITRMMPGATVLLGPEASEDSVYALARTRRLETYDCIHLAVHTTVTVRIDQFALVLSQLGRPGGPDGLLRNSEVWEKLRVNADVVTLGGCSSGQVTYGSGSEGPLGVGTPFLSAGARSFVGSMFAADDRASALVLTRFYENLTGAYTDDRGRGSSSPMRRVDALREAKLWLRSYRDERGATPYTHPAYWAGYVLVGDPG